MYCAPAPHSGQCVPVLVFGGSEGGLFTAATAELLASRGFPALALAYFDDALWPSPAYARAIMSRLDEYHDRYLHQELVYPGAGHSVGAAFPYDVGTVSFTTPAGTVVLGGTSFANSVAETSAWQRVLAFLRGLS